MIALYILAGIVALVLYLLLGKVAKRLSALLMAIGGVVMFLKWDREDSADIYNAVQDIFDEKPPFKAFWPVVLFAFVVYFAIIVVIGIAKMMWEILKILGQIVKWAWK
ncbi:MAG: hypothetical protein AAB465_00010 [Patescibacteria group bacterium]